MALSVTIPTHTTSSFPKPHILYNIHVSKDGKAKVVDKRYSDFITLNNSLAVHGIPLPPKRILVTTFIPSAWKDDTLVNERKTGLARYLSTLLQKSEYQNHPALLHFLEPSMSSNDMSFHPEDAVPSTWLRKTGLATAIAAKASAPVAAAYYPDWSAGSNPPENINFSKFDILFFAFAIPNQDGGLNWDSWSQDILRRLVTASRQSGSGTKIVLSAGGWGGSAGFSSATNNQNRSNFIYTLVNVVHDFDLDGVDIDWEYPNSEGAGNPHSSEDAGNLLQLFQGLRTALGTSKIISAAVPHLPWLGTNGQPLKDISAYAKEMTYINIMNYDVWGASANPGPNAPLSDACGTSTQPQASAEAAFNQWTAAGAPASKLLLGLPLYGYVSQSSRTTLSGSFAPPVSVSGSVAAALRTQGGGARPHPHPHPHRREGLVKPQAHETRTMATAADADLRSWYGQQIPFRTLVSSGALVKDSDGNYRAGGGFEMGWDDCSDTPYLFKPSQTTVVTYDDTWSLGDKAAFAKDRGMGGCFTWSVDQDDDGDALQNVVRARLGK
ncbi:hypothetical protein E1B28_013751 [Marasmius oreades]|nr:uncharacterized protein E1B28_013751 [Marasmius oreades]KAG7087811.1 hypothetical protein E1B28_013751 [Marasmius oreades]